MYNVKNRFALLSYRPKKFILSLADEQNLIFTEANYLFGELMKYMLIVATMNEPHSPPPALDPIWHSFILFDTRAYREFCDEHLGKFFDHQKTDAPFPRGGMMQVAEQLGLTLEPKIWGKSGNDADCVGCSDCG